MILALIPDAIKLPIAMALGAALMFYPATWIGASGGKAKVIQEMKDERITILKDGQKIDAEVLSADDGELCALLGGC